jgi:catechol 2,3-dioxygenase-like lactoylglutathione lyase family enzyme
MMSNPAPIPRLTAVTLGVRDFHASLLFYETLGFARRLRATGDEVAFLDAGGVVLALYPWDKLAQDAAVSTPGPPRLPEREGEGEVPARFRGTTLAWNCTDEVGRGRNRPFMGISCTASPVRSTHGPQ